MLYSPIYGNYKYGRIVLFHICEELQYEKDLTKAFRM